jgi:serine/threonine protein kinase
VSGAASDGSPTTSFPPRAPTLPDEEERLAELFSRLSDQAQRGEKVDLEAVCDAHPDLATELRGLWGVVRVAREVGSRATSNESDSKPSTFNPSPPLPCQFGKYELLERVGSGGMGVVYRAKSFTPHRIVALKMLQSGALATEDERRRFREEAEKGGRLEHPGIVPVYDVGEFQGQMYFVMRYIEGQTLSRRVAEGPLSPREAARILSQVCDAIEFAHQRGVIHRDLKPSNIILDEKGQPHVTDFGLAKDLDGVHESLTRTGAVLGTPAYMSPEQADGRRHLVGPVSDVYSLGSVLYHMLTGRPPFQATHAFEIQMMVREQEPTLPRFLNPKVDRDLEMIAMRALQKPPDLRQPSAAALQADLDAYLRGETPPSNSGRFTHIIGRLIRETHHATILENWGLLWMWHSVALFAICCLTNVLHLSGIQNYLYYFALWTAGLGSWAAVFWWLRKKQGPVLFVERQIAHVWGASMICIGCLFPVEAMLQLEVLKLSPVLALVSGMVFVVKAGILSGAFYFQAAALFATAFVMAAFPDYSHFIYGVVAALCFFLPGLKYYRQRRANLREPVNSLSSANRKGDTLT